MLLDSNIIIYAARPAARQLRDYIESRDIFVFSPIHVRDTTGLDVFLTHDTQLATAASASGLAVEGA